MKRLLALLLAILTVAVLAASCSSGGGETANTTAANAGTESVTAEAETEDPFKDDLPDSDFNGWKFRIGAANENNAYQLHFFYTEDMNGETVNDAVYTANSNVKERFNIDMTWVEIADTNYNAYKHVTTAVQAGDDIYDIVTLHDRMAVTAMLSDILYDLNKLPYIDYTKPWWPDFTVQSLTVNNKLYFACNSISYYGLASSRAVFMNREMAADLKIDIPYDMVREGTWTLDVMKSMSEKAYVDVNGDGKKDAGDRYGWAISGHTYDFFDGFGIDVLKHVNNGTALEIDFYKDFNIKVIEKTCQWFFGGGNDVFFNGSGSNAANKDALLMFANNQSLFSYNNIIRHVETCTDADMTYGILPQPKFDDSQKIYYGGANDNPICVPNTNTAYERTAIIMEAMAKEGKKIIEPAYIEIAMKSRYASDPDSAEMLEMIFNNRLLSAGYLYSVSTTAYAMAYDVFWLQGNATPDIASWTETQKPAEQKRVDEINAFFAKKD